MSAHSPARALRNRSAARAVAIKRDVMIDSKFTFVNTLVRNHTNVAFRRIQAVENHNLVHFAHTVGRRSLNLIATYRGVMPVI